MTGFDSPVMLFALLEGADVGVLRVGWVASIFQLHCKGQRRHCHAAGVTYPKELPQRRVVGLAWLALDVFLRKISAPSSRMLGTSSLPDPW